MKIASIIIPNEFLLPDTKVWIKDIHYGEFHFNKSKEFCEQNQLPIPEELKEFGDDPIYGDMWHTFLASKGHVVICISETSMIYLPPYITPEQRAWFLENRFYFDKNKLFAFAQFSSNGERIHMGNYAEDRQIVDSLYHLINTDFEIEKEGIVRR